LVFATWSCPDGSLLSLLLFFVYYSQNKSIFNDSGFFLALSQMACILTIVLAGTIIGQDAAESFIALFQGNDSTVKHLVVNRWESLTGALSNDLVKRRWTAHSYRKFGAAFKHRTSKLLTLCLHAGYSTFGSLCEYLTKTPACVVLYLPPSCQTDWHLLQILKSLLVNWTLGKGRNTTEKVLLTFKEAITIKFVTDNGNVMPNRPTQAFVDKLAAIVARNNTTGANTAYKALLKQRAQEYKDSHADDQARKRPRFHAKSSDV